MVAVTFAGWDTRRIYLKLPLFVFFPQGSVQCKAPEIEFQDPSASGYFQNQSGSSLNIADVFDFGGLWILAIKVALKNRPQNGVLQLLIQI